MKQVVVSWLAVIQKVSEKHEISKTEVCRRAGIAGGAATNMISRKASISEPVYSEGQLLVEQFNSAFPGEPLPTLERKAKILCVSCQINRQIEYMYRVAAGQYRCNCCVKRIATESQRKYTEKKNAAVAHG